MRRKTSTKHIQKKSTHDEEIIDLTLEEDEEEETFDPTQETEPLANDAHERKRSHEDMSGLGSGVKELEKVKNILLESFFGPLPNAAMDPIPSISALSSRPEGTRKRGHPRKRAAQNPLAESHSPSTPQHKSNSLTPESWAELKEALERNGHEQIMFWEGILQMLEEV